MTKFDVMLNASVEMLDKLNRDDKKDSMTSMMLPLLRQALGLVSRRIAKMDEARRIDTEAKLAQFLHILSFGLGDETISIPEYQLTIESGLSELITV